MSALDQLADWAPMHEAGVATASTALAIVLAVFLLRRVKRTAGGPTEAVNSASNVRALVRKRKFSAGTLSAGAAFIICTSVSLNTSYRFTLDGLGMTGTPERVLSCAAFEALLAMCVLGARERMADPESPSPGWYGGAVWVFAALSAIPAWHEGGGLSTGTAVRIIIGAFGSALAAHSMLGLELKHRSGKESEAPLAQITRDLRERLMSRMGLSVRNRTAQQISEERALSKAVDLADAYDRMSPKDQKNRAGRRCAKRLARAQDAAGLAMNPARTEEYRARVAQRRYATELTITETESPWHTGGTSEAQTEAQEEAARLREELAAARREVEALREEQARHIERLAASVEDALLAQVGTRLPGPRAEAHADLDELAYEGADDEAGDCIDEEPEARAAAAAHGARQRAEARVPDPEDEPQEDDEEDVEEPLRPLSEYPTKRLAIQALYRSRISPDDSRSVNAIVAVLLEEMAAQGMSYDRGAAHRAIDEVHTTAEESADEQHEDADEPVLAGV